MTAKTPLPELFNEHPMMAETIRHAVRANGWNTPKVHVRNEWNMRAADKAVMLDKMRDEGICDPRTGTLTEYGISIACHLMS